ncbi:hypothetical protein [Burkholderia pseudomultivorans]|uniref:Uncharacterized protein n=1 Tax=Burkholderia pseudomultivorans TaxID=1207504 RepID=A0A132EIM4_9BURK|nr:hypothetical protein [Burkholderia pseudomultivorans]KWF30431.1 hypothetical protein WT56_13430 [Burkholderia pseudomultivorans]
MMKHPAETKHATDLQQAAAHAYRLARDARDADPARMRAPAVVALQQTAARAYLDAAHAREAVIGV